MVKVLIKLWTLLFLCLVINQTHAQTAEKSLQEWVELCKDDFISPLSIRLELAGNFGECRPNHFHTGLDLKTQQRENLPIQSVANGYVSRISMSHSGYGHCLYITHPNGLTSVYAHLNTFSKPIQEYLEQRQVELESWNVNLIVPEGLLKVNQGEIIALSGNTGGSVAPHLHFELRETSTQFAINPLAFKAFKIHDQIAPVIKQLGIYNAATSIYNQKPELYSLSSLGNNKYQANEINTSHNEIFLGFHVEDFMNGSNNWLGIYSLKVFVNDTLHFETKMDAIDLSINRMMNSYIDYSTYKSSKKVFQLAYILPNNFMKLYPFSKQKGAIQLAADKTTAIRVEIKDYHNNLSTLALKINKKNEAHSNNNKTITRQLDSWIPGVSQTFEHSYFWVKSQSLSVYDTVNFEFKEVFSENGALSANITLNSQEVPIHTPITLAIRLTQPLPIHLRSKLVLLHQVQASKLPGRGAQNAVAAKFDQGFAVVDISNFGNYQVAIDTVPPSIKLSTSNNLKVGQSLRIQVEESMTYISHFAAYLEDGTWLNMRRVKNEFIFSIPDSWKKSEQTIKIWASDANNNTSQQDFKIQIQ